jgi:hypothetical protein
MTVRFFARRAGAALLAIAAAALPAPASAGARYGAQAPPAPYRWASPPAGVGRTATPLSASTVLPSTLVSEATAPVPAWSLDGQQSTSASTPDGQATLLFDSGSVPPVPGQESIRVTLTPEAGQRVGSPPARQSYWSNAYQINAAYEPSGEPVTDLSVGVLLAVPSIPATATQGIGPTPPGAAIARWNGSSWTTLPASTTQFAALSAPTTTLGIFVVVAPEPFPAQPSRRGWLLAALVLGAAALVAGTLSLWGFLRRRAEASAPAVWVPGHSPTLPHRTQ